MNSIQQIIPETISTGAEIYDSTDGLDKFAKFALAIFDAIECALPLPILLPLKLQLQSYTKVYGAFKVVYPLRDFVAPQKNGKFFFEEVRWQNTAGRLGLLVGQTLTTITFLESCKILEFSQVAGKNIGRIVKSVGLSQLMGVTFTAAGVFFAWDGIYTQVDLSSKLKKNRLKEQRIESFNFHEHYQQKLNQCLENDPKRAKYTEIKNCFSRNQGMEETEVVPNIKEAKQQKIKAKIASLEAKSVKNGFTLAAGISKVVQGVFLLTAGYFAAIMTASMISGVVITLSVISATIALVDLIAKIKIQGPDLSKLPKWNQDQMRYVS